MSKGKKIAVTIISIILAICIALAVLYCFADRILIGNTKTEEFDTGSSSFKVGVISDTQLGYIMEFSDNSIDIHRFNFADGDFGYEEKSDMLWSLSLPYENDGKYSFDSRKALNTAPVMTDTNAVANISGEDVFLSFKAGKDDDFVHSYKVVIDGKEAKYFFSDFYNGIDNMSEEVTLQLKASEGKHTYEIYAVDSWGAESKECATVEM